jgi:hypothetical protein
LTISRREVPAVCGCGNTCACHIGGAYRPACSIPGGCGLAPAGANTPAAPQPRPLDQCQADGCDRHVHSGQTLCGRHYATLAYAIADCLEAWRWLADPTAGSGRPTGPRVSGSREEPLPIDPARTEQRALARSTVDSWARRIAAGSGVLGPFARTPSGDGPSEPVQTVCRWLVLRLPWVARQPYAAAMLAELRDVAAGAWRIAPRRGRPMQRLPLPCPACGMLSLGYMQDTGLVECRMPDCPEQMGYAAYRSLVTAAVSSTETVAPATYPAGEGDDGGLAGGEHRGAGA